MLNSNSCFPGYYFFELIQCHSNIWYDRSKWKTFFLLCRYLGACVILLCQKIPADNRVKYNFWYSCLLKLCLIFCIYHGILFSINFFESWLSCLKLSVFRMLKKNCVLSLSITTIPLPLTCYKNIIFFFLDNLFTVFSYLYGTRIL